MSRAHRHGGLNPSAAVPQHGPNTLGEAECVPAAGMGGRGDERFQICSANLLWPSETKDPVTTHSRGLSPHFMHMQWRRHTPKALLSPPQQEIFLQSCRTQAGAWQTSSINPFLFLCLGQKVLHSGTLLGSSFEDASLLHAELVQKMPRDSEIQGLAGSQEFISNLPWWSHISKEAQVG